MLLAPGTACGAFMNGQWLQWEWPKKWDPQGIIAKELVPIVFICIAWAHSSPSSLY